MTTRRRKREEEDTQHSGGHYTRELPQHKNSVPTRVMLYARDRSPQVSRQTRVEDMWLFLYAPCSVVEPHEEPSSSLSLPPLGIHIREEENPREVSSLGGKKFTSRLQTLVESV